MASITAIKKDKLESEPYLPFSAPWFGEDEKRELLAALESDWITTGPRTKQFEAEFAKYIGCREALAVNSCTAALHLALAALRIGEGDAVITTCMTFAATANTIVHQRAYPVLLDIEPDTYNLDPKQLRRYLTESCRWDEGENVLRDRQTAKKIRAIVVVHYGGHPCDMEEISGLASEYGLNVIEDAAHALGAKYKGNNVGTLGDIACFSFYATKNITTGEGGMLTAYDPELAKRARVLCLHGISSDAWNRYSKEGTWRYDITEAGFKYNLTDLASAIGIHQLRRSDLFMERRKELAAQYREKLGSLPLKHPTERAGVESAWHLYPVQVMSRRINRDAVIQELKARNIGTSVHFIPLHLMSYYQRTFGYSPGQFPVADEVFSRIVSLPFFARMADQDVDRVVNALGEILA
jgi:dTDP-4-amino-4,6-dideoxygalactose transaminase